MVALAVCCIERRGQMSFVACNRNRIQNYWPATEIGYKTITISILKDCLLGISPASEY
jgi:hypothetical protein